MFWIGFVDVPPRYSSLEFRRLFRQRAFSQDMKAVDAWALGCLLSKLIFGEDIPELVSPQTRDFEGHRDSNRVLVSVMKLHLNAFNDFADLTNCSCTSDTNKETSA